MTAKEKLDEYLFLLKYVVFRNTEYHFADAMPYGYIVPAARRRAARLRARRARVAIALWGSIVVVARGRRAERAGSLAERALHDARRRVAPRARGARRGAAPRTAGDAPSRRARLDRAAPRATARALAAALALVALFVVHQAPKMRDQIWFFGRASRNIRDQHITAGRVLRQMTPRPKRVLVGDAGALLYASDLPGLDLIGLGGYHDLPFARAGVHGLGATLELIERMPAADRPDVFAIYPSWWGDLPSWFGRRSDRGSRARQRDLRRLREGHLPRRLARARTTARARARCAPAKRSSTSSTSPIS